MTCLQKSEQPIGELRLRRVTMNVGQVLHGHRHVRDHVTILHTGKIHILATCDQGCKKEIDLLHPGDSYNVPKNWTHEITALEDNTVYTCMFVRLNANGDLWQQGQPEDLTTDQEQ